MKTAVPSAHDLTILDRVLALRNRHDLIAREAMTEMLAVLSDMTPDTAVFVGLFDFTLERFAVVDWAGLGTFGLRPGLAGAIEQSFCCHMARAVAPNLTNDAAAHPIYGSLPAQSALGISSYLGMPLNAPDGGAFGSLCVISHAPFAFTLSNRRVISTSALLLSRLVNQERLMLARDGEPPSTAEILGLETRGPTPTPCGPDH